MTWKRIIDVDNNRLVLDLPADFKHKKVLVQVEEIDDHRATKLQQLRGAADDPLFLADIDAVQDDFRAVDGELL